MHFWQFAAEFKYLWANYYCKNNKNHLFIHVQSFVNLDIVLNNKETLFYLDGVK